MPKVKIKSIMCILNDEIDKDEVFLKLKGKKIWPEKSTYKSIDSGEKTAIDLDVEHEAGEMVIEVWDFDYMTRNDHLGTFTMMIDDQKGNYTTSMKLNDENSTASYILEWSVI